MDFKHKLYAAQAKNNSLLCVGLDPDLELMPASVTSQPNSLLAFCIGIIETTADLVCAYKPNSAFFEARGAEGISALKEVSDYLSKNYPDIPLILDCKRGDIGSTNEKYAEFAFDYIGADAITAQPYQGQEALQAFFDRKDKGIIVLCRTSNKGSAEIQDLEVDGRRLYLKVADDLAKTWNSNGNCLLVVGATFPEQIAEVRALVGDEIDFLIPGVGAQGGNIEATVKAGRNAQGTGMIINSTRDIIYASSGEDWADAARTRAQATRDEINKYRS